MEPDVWLPTAVGVTSDIMPDHYLLIDPGMAVDGICGDDGCDPILDEGSGAVPICIGGAGCGGLGRRTAQDDAQGADRLLKWLTG